MLPFTFNEYHFKSFLQNKITENGEIYSAISFINILTEYLDEWSMDPLKTEDLTLDDISELMDLYESCIGICQRKD